MTGIVVGKHSKTTANVYHMMDTLDQVVVSGGSHAQDQHTHMLQK